MTGAYGPTDPREAAATVLEALDSGVTMFDTGDFYGDGANEELLGRTLAPRRDHAMLATKTGVRRTAEGLVPVGSPKDLRRAHAVHPISAVQTEYSLRERHVEIDILPTIRSLGAALIAYSPLSLGLGLLTGAVRASTRYEPGDFRATAPRYNGDGLKANLTIVDAITHLAATKSATPAQIALAWLLTRGGDVIPTPGSSRRPHLRDNLAALNLHLTATDLGDTDATVPDAGAQGARYGDHGIALIHQ